jgi:hypothetical protein
MIDELQPNPEDLNLQEEQNDIFLQSLVLNEFKGKALEPFCYVREQAAIALGLRFFSLTPSEIEELLATNSYKGINIDALLVLWLCLQPKSEVMKAIRLPSQAFEKVISFGEKEGINVGTPEFTFASQLFMEKMVAILKTRGQFKRPGDKSIEGKGEESSKN